MRPLAGLKVVEVADELGAYAGKLFGDAGAEVVKVEPPGGAETRTYGPFVDDIPGPNRSLYFAYYNTSKSSRFLDLDSAEGTAELRELAAEADILIDGLGPGAMESRGLSYERLAASNPGLIYLAVTPFGQEGPWTQFKTSDLVSLALGGPLFDCGYDDHTIPPIRGGGNQAYNTASHLTFLSGLIALLWRQKSGHGQYVDVSMHDSCATTVEFSNLYWFYNQVILARQTCRHAMPVMTQRAHFRCADGRYVFGTLRFNDPKAWNSVKAMLDERGLLLDLAAEEYNDPDYRRQNIGVIQERIESLAAVCTADEFYHRAQSIGMVVGVIRSPEDLANDHHLQARNFFVEIGTDDWGRSIRFPGAPYRFTSMECGPGAPPRMQEDPVSAREQAG